MLQVWRPAAACIAAMAFLPSTGDLQQLLLSLLLPCGSSSSSSSSTTGAQQLLQRLLALQCPLYAAPLSSLFNRFPAAAAAALLRPLLTEAGQQQLQQPLLQLQQQQQAIQSCSMKQAFLEVLLQHLEITSARPLR